MWNRFDICEAWYLFACYYHPGGRSPEYQIFGRLHRIGFQPSPMLAHDSTGRLSKDDRQNVRDILAGLIRKQRRGWRPRAR